MSTNPGAPATARQHLVERITRFLEAVEREHREPNRLEAEFVLSTLGFLGVDQWPMGECAMMVAERAASATPPEIANARPDYEPVTIAYLRADLEKILRTLPLACSTSARPRCGP
jgi:hypothetical protein